MYGRAEPSLAERGSDCGTNELAAGPRNSSTGTSDTREGSAETFNTTPTMALAKPRTAKCDAANILARAEARRIELRGHRGPTGYGPAGEDDVAVVVRLGAGRRASGGVGGLPRLR